MLRLSKDTEEKFHQPLKMLYVYINATYKDNVNTTYQISTKLHIYIATRDYWGVGHIFRAPTVARTLTTLS